MFIPCRYRVSLKGWERLELKSVPTRPIRIGRTPEDLNVIKPDRDHSGLEANPETNAETNPETNAETSLETNPETSLETRFEIYDSDYNVSSNSSLENSLMLLRQDESKVNKLSTPYKSNLKLGNKKRRVNKRKAGESNDESNVEYDLEHLTSSTSPENYYEFWKDSNIDQPPEDSSIIYVTVVPDCKGDRIQYVILNIFLRTNTGLEEKRITLSENESRSSSSSRSDNTLLNREKLIRAYQNLSGERKEYLFSTLNLDSSNEYIEVLETYTRLISLYSCISILYRLGLFYLFEPFEELTLGKELHAKSRNNFNHLECNFELLSHFCLYSDIFKVSERLNVGRACMMELNRISESKDFWNYNLNKHGINTHILNTQLEVITTYGKYIQEVSHKLSSSINNYRKDLDENKKYLQSLAENSLSTIEKELKENNTKIIDRLASFGEEVNLASSNIEAKVEQTLLQYQENSSELEEQVEEAHTTISSLSEGVAETITNFCEDFIERSETHLEKEKNILFKITNDSKIELNVEFKRKEAEFKGLLSSFINNLNLEDIVQRRFDESLDLAFRSNDKILDRMVSGRLNRLSPQEAEKSLLRVQPSNSIRESLNVDLQDLKLRVKAIENYLSQEDNTTFHRS